MHLILLSGGMRHSQSCQSFSAAETAPSSSIVTTATAAAYQTPSTTSSVQLRRRKQQSQKELCQKLEEFRRKSRSTVVNPDDVKIVSSGSSQSSSSARPARAKSEEVAFKNQVRYSVLNLSGFFPNSFLNCTLIIWGVRSGIFLNSWIIFKLSVRVLNFLCVCFKLPLLSHFRTTLDPSDILATWQHSAPLTMSIFMVSNLALVLIIIHQRSHFFVEEWPRIKDTRWLWSSVFSIVSSALLWTAERWMG